MAAPASKTIGDINGKWALNKTLSDPVDPALSMQGIGWLTRKAIGAASVTLDIKQYIGAPKPPSTSTEQVTRIDITQLVTGGLKGTQENRSLDDEFREHSDWLFGTVRGHGRWMGADELAALVAAGGEAVAKGWVDGSGFLAADWIEEGEGGGPKGETHVYSFVESLDSDWTATQVWGFQMVGGERRYARNVVVAKKGKFYNMKMIYDFLSE
ncbi:Uu.00g037800.m01.CDS01 [Anthostomella pinea]|uniref:Uu.00g037800.m01.CDS01 n=1 Tax=Anthostomella pinea TaxID=933095 RepID=A0AAI8YDP6_9PEZI|nr:Uu.00g037800.m01.CDS01 [Anthostomella pinea]